MVGVLGTYFNGIVLDEFISGFSRRKRVCILSQKHEEVADYIMHELKRGVTLYEAKGGYDKQVRCEVVTILAKNEYALLMEHIRKNDPSAFVTVSTVSEIVGSWNTKYGVRITKLLQFDVNKKSPPDFDWRIFLTYFLGHQFSIGAVQNISLSRDDSLFIKIQNTVVHCDHAVRSRRKDKNIDLMGFGFADQISDRTVADHDFKCSHNAAVYSRNKLLGNNGLKYHRKLNTDLCLLVWRKASMIRSIVLEAPTVCRVENTR